MTISYFHVIPQKRKWRDFHDLILTIILQTENAMIQLLNKKQENHSFQQYCITTFHNIPGFCLCKIVNIYSGKHFLHSTKPEITVTVDGIKHPVGDVSGQFGHTFIDSSWYGKFCKSE